MTLFKKSESTMTPELKARKQAAEAAAEIVRSSEAALLGALSTLQAARNRAIGIDHQIAEHRQKIGDLLRGGDVQAAEKIGRSIVDAQAATEVATVHVELHAKNVADCEEALIRAEETALTAFQAVHAHQHDAMREGLVSDVQTRWRSAWKHAQAAGSEISFASWARAVLHDGHVNVADEHLPDVDLSGLPPHPTQAQSVGFTERRQIKDRIWQRENG